MDIIEAKKQLEIAPIGNLNEHLTHMEVLNIFEAVAKRCGIELMLFTGRRQIYIGNFEELTEAMFEAEFKLIMERSLCRYDDESQDWVMYV
jgi:hypothetical protein